MADLVVSADSVTYRLPADVRARQAVDLADQDTEVGGALSATFASLKALGVVAAINYGIVADGTTDNTAPLNTLMANVSAAGGGHIVLPAGILRTTTALIQQSNIWLSGAGRDLTIIKPLQHGFYRNATATSPIYNFHLSDLTIDGADRAGAQPTWKGYHGQYHRQCTWSNLAVRNTGMTGLGPDFLDDCVIFNVVTEDTGLENDGTMPSGNGIGIGAGGSQGTADWPAESFLVTGCHVKRAKRFGIMYEGGITPSSVKIIGNSVTGCEAGFDISGGTGAIIIGNNAYSNVGAGFHVGTATLDSSLAGQQGRISNNYSRANGGSGIIYEALIHAPAGPVFAITDNTCASNAIAGIEVNTATADLIGLDISGNNLAFNTGAGVLVRKTGAWTAYALAIDNNRFIQNATGPGADAYGQLVLKMSTNGSSISGNLFQHRSTMIATPCINFGSGGVATVQTGLKVHSNQAYGLKLRTEYGVTWTARSFLGNIGTDVDPNSVALATKTASYTVANGDYILVMNGTTVIVYLPAAATTPIGRRVIVKNINATACEVRSSSDSIDGVAVSSLAQWATGTYVCDGARWLKL